MEEIKVKEKNTEDENFKDERTDNEKDVKTQEPDEGEISEQSAAVTDKRIAADNVREESDTEEGGYRSDQSASEEGSTDNVIDRRRSKGSSGYEESDDYEEEGSDVSEGHKPSGGEEEKEYDKGVSENGSSDSDVLVDSGSEEGTEGYEEDKEDESKEEGGDEFSGANEDWKEEEEKKEHPASVPRRTGFWGHDDRYDETPIEESRAPRKEGVLWDRTAERWEHDRYKAEEQIPKERWEVEESIREYEEGLSRRRRDGRSLGDFVDRRGRGGRGGRGGGDGRHPRNRRQQEHNQERKYEGDRPRYKENGDKSPGHDRRRREKSGPAFGENQDRKQIYNSDVKEHTRGPHHRTGESTGGRDRTRKDGDDWNNDEERTNQNVKHAEHINEKIGRKPQRKEMKHVEQQDQVTRDQNKEDIIGKKDSGDQRASQQNSMKNQEGKPSSTRKEELPEAEHRGPRGRGKGITSEKITSAKKTAVDYRKEQQKSEEIHKDKGTYEDAEEEVRDDDDASQQKHGTVKPKRYSSQRQRQGAAGETPVQIQGEETLLEGQQYYNQNPQANYQSQMPVLDPNMLMMLQQQLQQMQMQQPQQQQQPVQAQNFEQQPQPQQQMPGVQTQGPLMMTPSMQQYMQQQFLRIQSVQQMYMQQQQQLQQQQQMQQQQMQGMRMRQPTMPANESQAAAPEGGMMVPRNSYPTVASNMPTVAPNMQHYNMVQPTQTAIYPQGGSQYDVLRNQLVPERQTSTQQPGLYIPPVQQTQQQQQTDENAEQYGQRKPRPAAIPIKPPPEVQ